MFQGWWFLVGEIWALIILASLIGLMAGWLIWGGQNSKRCSVLKAELEQCRSELEIYKQASQTTKATSSHIDNGSDDLVESDTKSFKPKSLSSPRDGLSDDLKKIKGIGPKLENL